MNTLYQINLARCSGCGLCAKACPQQAIVIEGKEARILDERCSGCGTCQTICRRGAVLALPAPLQPVSASPAAAAPRRTRRRAHYLRWRTVHLSALQSTGLRRPEGRP